MGFESNNNFETKSLKQLEHEKFLAETKQQKEKLKENISDSIINRLNSKKGYTIRTYDELGLINKITSIGNHINFNNEGNKIWPGDIIRIIDGKVFRTHNGENQIVGIVTKGFKVKKETNNTVTENTQPNTTDTTQETTNTQQTNNTETKSSQQNTTDTTNYSENNEVNDSPTYVEHYIFKNGRPFLVLEDGTTKESSKELSKEDLDKIKSFEKVAILNEILDIWKTEANNTIDGLFWKSARNDDEIIQNQIKGIEKDFSNLYNGIITNKSGDIKSLINSIFERIQKAESEESIIGSDDMEEVKNTLLSDNLNKDEKLIKIFNLMRYKGLSGNSATIKEKVANHLLIQPEFKNISDILKNENLLPYIENNKKDELSKLIGNNDLANEIINSYNKIKVKQEKNRENYSKILEKINKEKKTKGEKEIKLDDFIKLNVDYSIQTLIKHTLLEAKLNSMPNRGNEDSYKGIYANISGLGKTSTGDILVIADDNIDTAIDIGTTLAISAVTMGVGMLAAKGAMMAVNYGSKTLKIGKATSRAGSLARFAGTAGVEGTSFYMGTNTMNNLIYGNFEGYNIGENNLNLKEISKSIAFMGVLRGVGKVMESVGSAQMTRGLAKTLNQKDTITKSEKILAKIGDLTGKVHPLMFKNTSITGVLAEAGLLTGTSTGIEIVFEGEGNWSWEEYMQALVMVGLFRGAGKIKFSKNKDGKIEAKTEQQSTDNSGKKESTTTAEQQSAEQKLQNKTLTKYENNRFNELIKKDFKESNSITLTNKKGESITINKEINGKYSIAGDNKTFSLKEILEKIDDSFKIKKIEDFNYENIVKIAKGEEITIGKTLNLPFTGRIKILEGGQIEILGKNKKPISDPEKIKRIINIPKVRELILKQKLENMTTKELVEKVKNLKGFEKLKGLSSGAFQMGVERLKALVVSGLIGGTSSTILFEILNDKKADNKTDRLLELIETFAWGAGGGLVFSGLKTGTIITWGLIKGTTKVGWNTISAPINFIRKQGVKRISLAIFGMGGTYYVFKD